MAATGPAVKQGFEQVDRNLAMASLAQQGDATLELVVDTRPAVDLGEFR